MTIWVRNKYDVLTSVSTRTHRSKYVVLVSVSTRTYSHQVRHFFSPIPKKTQSSKNQTLTKHQFSRKRTDEHTHNNNLRQAKKRSILDLPTQEESLGRKSLGFKSKYCPLQRASLYIIVSVLDHIKVFTLFPLFQLGFNVRKHLKNTISRSQLNMLNSGLLVAQAHNLFIHRSYIIYELDGHASGR